MRVSECASQLTLPYTVNMTHPEERAKVEEAGQSIAREKGLNYEGYAVFTSEPFSLEQAKAVLYFN